ncbi:hypothetical protein D3C80_1016980 [compost metagenome]
MLLQQAAEVEDGGFVGNALQAHLLHRELVQRDWRTSPDSGSLLQDFPKRDNAAYNKAAMPNA